MRKGCLDSAAHAPATEEETLIAFRALLLEEESEDDEGPGELADSSDDEDDTNDIESVAESEDESPGCCNIGSTDVKAAFVCDVVFPTEVYNTGLSPEEEYVDVEVILDSGAGAHVAAKKHIPGYHVRESELKKAGASFVAIDGGRIENEGEAEINLVVLDGKGTGHDVRTTVQVADVTRALWSVGVQRDAGPDPRFTPQYAKIYDKKGVELCHFARQNGLYVATVKLRNPAFQGSRRQGR